MSKHLPNTPLSRDYHEDFNFQHPPSVPYTPCVFRWTNRIRYAPCGKESRRISECPSFVSSFLPWRLPRRLGRITTLGGAVQEPRHSTRQNVMNSLTLAQAESLSHSFSWKPFSSNRSAPFPSCDIPPFSFLTRPSLSPRLRVLTLGFNHSPPFRKSTSTLSHVSTPATAQARAFCGRAAER
jgi:hypothetical protein